MTPMVRPRPDRNRVRVLRLSSDTADEVQLEGSIIISTYLPLPSLTQSDSIHVCK